MPKIKLQDPEKIKKIYFVGIKGVGMTSLAIIAKEAGFSVQGSDVKEEFLTDEVLSKNGIKVDISFSKKNLKEFVKGFKNYEILVVTTAAHEGLNNLECRYAKELGIKVITQGQAVGLFMQGELFKKKFKGISILGCHGKTTVTSMAATALSMAGLEPSYAVGASEIFPLKSPGHLGKGKYFIAEADEFISDLNHDRTVKFLYQYPEIAIINNIDFDHPDVYADINQVYNSFLQFTNENISKNGTLIINGDDDKTTKLKAEVEKNRKDLNIITYGQKNTNMIRILNFREYGWKGDFEVFIKNRSIGRKQINVPGFHNAKNMLSVISLMYTLNIKLDKITEIVPLFKGSKRRQEKVGETKAGAAIIDDYAHHPDEIIKTLDAAKSAYSGKKIIAIFQPHTVGRTKSLSREFANAFANIFKVIFLPVFSSKREKNEDYSIIYKKIEEQMKKSRIDVHFFKDQRQPFEMDYSPYSLKKYRSNVVKYVLKHFNSKDYVILTLGAGDVYKIAYDLIQT